MTDLTPFNTLRVPARAQKFTEINSPSDLSQLNPTDPPPLFLGHGANLLFRSTQIPHVAKINLLGKQVSSASSNWVEITAAAGENWHELVAWTTDNGWWGMENLALIPGTVGAAAVGNIAAYNQNQEDIFVSLTAYDLTSGRHLTLAKPDLDFAYRHSALQSQPHLLVTSVTYRLSASAQPDLSYSATQHQSLASKLQQLFPHHTSYSPKQIFTAIVQLRTEKMPDWRALPNAGSFFKNPLVPKAKYLQLKSLFPHLPAYPAAKLIQTADTSWLESATHVKLPAGFLLDQLGWRGKRIGNVGTHVNQALCVINYGATGEEIYEFAESMRADFHRHFGVDLEYEVKII